MGGQRTLALPSLGREGRNNASVTGSGPILEGQRRVRLFSAATFGFGQYSAWEPNSAIAASGCWTASKCLPVGYLFIPLSTTFPLRSSAEKA
jgi:hypothetical protein